MSDAYSLVNSFAILVIIGLSSGVATAYIPGCTEIADGRERDRFTSNVMNVSLIGTAVLAAISFIFADRIVAVLGAGFTGAAREYAIAFLRFVLLASMCVIMVYLINGYLNVRGYFLYDGFQLVLTNSIVIASVALGGDDPWKIGIGYCVSYAVPLLLGIFLLQKHGFQHSAVLECNDGRLRRIYATALIAFLGTNMVKFDVMVDRVFASSMREGTVASINYAHTLLSVFPEVAILPLAAVSYPKLAECFASGNTEKMNFHIKDLLMKAVMLLLPVTAIFMKMGNWVVEVLFQRGAFDEAATSMTAGIMDGYFGEMLGIGLTFVLCRIFFARKEEWIPAICSGGGHFAESCA